MKKLSLEKIACIVVMLCALGGVTVLAQTFTTIASFDGTDGANPVVPLVQGANGDFYGTTGAGGANKGGTIFEVAPAGTVTTLYSFSTTGEFESPSAPQGLVQTANGDFYGTTNYGGPASGSISCYGAASCGTVFEIGAESRLVTLYSFCPQINANSDLPCPDGVRPYGTLVQGYDGYFYATTLGGGVNENCESCGTVFKMTPDGTMTTLYIFCSLTNCADGETPETGLVQAADGKFYGTTTGGGANGGGTIFSITPAGELTTLYSFCSRSQTGCVDGKSPSGPLFLAPDGNLYGTTFYGGPIVGTDVDGYGTAFEITPTGKLTTLYNFCSQPNCTDGAYPGGGLIQATDGNLYGATPVGGTYGRGTIFEITPQGILTTLYSFCSQPNCADGAGPTAGLVQATDGIFYGTAALGGACSANCGNGLGTIFSLSTGLAPFVETLPVARKVGLPVTILGNNLTGTTSVTFNGTAATLITVSDTAITTTVPTGATTGPVEVVTPSGTLTSNVPFQVIP
jgi:uncharacterized repeat protein (TIGR03803 family)